jgi:hypothetical protein
MLILCLSFPVFAGHVQGGGFGYCPCDNPESHNTLNGVIRDDSQETAPNSDITLGLLLIAALLYLKAKA